MNATAMTWMKVGTAVATIGLVALISCTPDTPPMVASTDDVDVFARTVLNSVQARSIAQSREYCGYIFLTTGGGMAATAPRAGQEDYCDLPAPDANVIASYHTHGGYSDVYDNEVPSLDDMRGDIETGIDGYISTPGGRLWLIDHELRIARQLCSAPCVITDPNDNPDDAGYVPRSFTLEALEARFG